MPSSNRKRARPSQYSPVNQTRLSINQRGNTNIIVRTLASLVVGIVYGFKIESMNDDFIKTAVETADVFSESHLTGRFWVNIIPWLKYIPSWVPGTDAVRFGGYWRPKVVKAINTPFDTILSGMVSLQYIHSLTVQTIL
jgi:hypothetical protein